MQQLVDRTRRLISEPQSELDPSTIMALERLGVAAGWQCLAAGAGDGAADEWLGRRVGPTGRVVAVGVSSLAAWCGDPAWGKFDLAWARGVLERVPNPARVLRHLAGALRPGGWLFAEAADWGSLRLRGPLRLVYAKFIEAMGAAGCRPARGVGLGEDLYALGLSDVEVQGRTAEWCGAGRAHRAAIEAALGHVTGLGYLTEAEANELRQAVRAPDFRAVTMTHYAAWGRKMS
jgi:SAM-dependent methyltransferase